MMKKMVLLPEEQAALVLQQRLNITPQLRKMATLQTVKQHILNNSDLSKGRRKQLLKQLLIKERNAKEAYDDKGVPALRVEKKPPRVQRPGSRAQLATTAPTRPRPRPTRPPPAIPSPLIQRARERTRKVEEQLQALKEQISPISSRTKSKSKVKKEEEPMEWKAWKH